MTKYLSNWSAKRSGATMTISGKDENGEKVTVSGIVSIGTGKGGLGIFAQPALKSAQPIKLEAMN